MNFLPLTPTILAKNPTWPDNEGPQSAPSNFGVGLRRGRCDAPPRSSTPHMKRRMRRPSRPGVCFSAPRFSGEGARLEQKDAGPPRHRPGGLVPPRKCAGLHRFDAAEGALRCPARRATSARVGLHMRTLNVRWWAHMREMPLGSCVLGAVNAHPAGVVQARPVPPLPRVGFHLNRHHNRGRVPE